MMLRLVGMLVLALSMVLSTAIGGARLVSHPPDLPLTALFTYPDGESCPRPCLLGVRPGVPFDEAIRLVQQHPMTDGFYSEFPSEGLLIFAGPTMTVVVNNVDQPVTAVYFAAPYLLLSDLIRLLDTPEVVHADLQGRHQSLWLYYDLFQLGVETRAPARERLSPTDPVMKIMLAGSGFLVGQPQRAWQGFAAVRRYR